MMYKKTGIDKRCANCNISFKTKKSTYGKFCSIKCNNDYKFKTISIPKVLAGEGNVRNIKKYLKSLRNECWICGQKTLWNGKELKLQLDHIDGNSDNNLPNNIRLVCPNCHSQTETFSSKGFGNKIKKETNRNKYLRKYKSGE